MTRETLFGIASYSRNSATGQNSSRGFKARSILIFSGDYWEPYQSRGDLLSDFSGFYKIKTNLYFIIYIMHLQLFFLKYNQLFFGTQTGFKTQIRNFWHLTGNRLSTSSLRSLLLLPLLINTDTYCCYRAKIAVFLICFCASATVWQLNTKNQKTTLNGYFLIGTEKCE